jgi:hypothetical protein
VESDFIDGDFFALLDSTTAARQEARTMASVPARKHAQEQAKLAREAAKRKEARQKSQQRQLPTPLPDEPFEGEVVVFRTEPSPAAAAAAASAAAPAVSKKKKQPIIEKPTHTRSPAVLASKDLVKQLNGIRDNYPKSPDMQLQRTGEILEGILTDYGDPHSLADYEWPLGPVGRRVVGEFSDWLQDIPLESMAAYLPKCLNEFLLLARHKTPHTTSGAGFRVLAAAIAKTFPEAVALAFNDMRSIMTPEIVYPATCWLVAQADPASAFHMFLQFLFPLILDKNPFVKGAVVTLVEHLSTCDFSESPAVTPSPFVISAYMRFLDMSLSGSLPEKVTSCASAFITFSALYGTSGSIPKTLVKSLFDRCADATKPKVLHQALCELFVDGYISYPQNFLEGWPPAHHSSPATSIKLLTLVVAVTGKPPKALVQALRKCKGNNSQCIQLYNELVPLPPPEKKPPAPKPVKAVPQVPEVQPEPEPAQEPEPEPASVPVPVPAPEKAKEEPVKKAKIKAKKEEEEEEEEEEDQGPSVLSQICVGCLRFSLAAGIVAVGTAAWAYKNCCGEKWCTDLVHQATPFLPWIQQVLPC